MSKFIRSGLIMSMGLIAMGAGIVVILYA